MDGMKMTIQVAYDGDRLRDGSMDVRDLAPAMLALGRLVEAANLAVNGDRAAISVRVRATSRGSFEVHFDLVQSLLERALHLFNSGGVTAVLNIAGLLGIGETGRRSLIWLLKRLKGK